MYRKNLITLLVVFLCSLTVGAQSLIRETPLRGNHHTHRLPGVNERRLARLEKMREQNNALRRQQGPWRANAEAQTKRGLVLLVEFSDEGSKLSPNAANEWYNRFNQQGYSLYKHVGSVRDYFYEQSYGMLNIEFDVVGPLTLSKTREYYGSSPNSHLDDRAAEMVIEALRLADAQVNYADYDWGGNGWVDQVYVIYAGVTQYATQGYIWPHEWNLASAYSYGCGTGRQRRDGVYIDTYAVSNELASSKTLSGIGTACHEFSHCLGYPDFYDTNYGGGTAAQNWDVLDGGCYNGPQGIGEIPSPYTAYERWMAGWIDLTPLTEPCKVRDMPAINEEGVGYIIRNTGNTNEYYILENRQQKTFGKGNRGHGLMVWHIDYNRSSWGSNNVNSDVNHQRMTFLPADGQVGILTVDEDGYAQYQISAEDEAGDPYPGNQNVDSVKQLTWFVAEKYGTKNHANRIHDITEGIDGKISFTYGDYLALPTPEVLYPTILAADRFTANWKPVEGATSYNLQVEAITGMMTSSTILAEDFSGFSAAGEGSQIGSSVIDKYTQTPGWTGGGLYGTGSASLCLSSRSIAGHIMTPALENRAGTLTVEFDAAYLDTDETTIEVSVYNAEGVTVLATETVTLTPVRTTCKCSFEDIPTGCKVEFASTKRNKRFYLYNVNIMDIRAEGSTVTTYTGLTATSYTVESAELEQFYYRVQAVCEDGESEWSEWMDVDIASSMDNLMDNKQEGEMPNGTCFDLSGRQLRREPQRGLYIRNGKTYLVR